MDSIEISNIACRVRLGVPDNERRFPQTVMVDVRVEFDFSYAVATDQFRDTLDYERVVHLVAQVASSRSWSLLETLADSLCGAVLSIPKVETVQVKARKFPVSLKGKADSVTAVVQRSRDPQTEPEN